MSFSSNLLPRLRLLRTALTRRFIWSDLTAMVKAHGFELREVRGNQHPLAFANDVVGRGGSQPATPPDFAATLGNGNDFALASTHAWNSERSVSEFLGQLVFHLRPRAVVELGCYVGWTSAHLALGIKASAAGGRLLCVDSDPRFLEAARRNLQQRGLGSNVEFIQGYSTEANVLGALPEHIDLLFIDTTHQYDDTHHELAVYRQRLAPGGIIALHDSISQDGVRRVVRDVWQDFETMTFGTELGNGLTILRGHKP